MSFQPFLVQIFLLILKNVGELVKKFELKRIGGAPKGHQFAPPKKNLIRKTAVRVLRDSLSARLCQAAGDSSDITLSNFLLFKLVIHCYYLWFMKTWLSKTGDKAIASISLFKWCCAH